MKALFRGFCRNENGKETIYLNGEAVKGEWVYGDLFHNLILDGVHEKEIRIGDVYFYGDEIHGTALYEVIPETVSEAVRGLTDKNGQHVFEGDHIKDKYGTTYLVFYNNNNYAFMAKVINSTRLVPSRGPLYCIEDFEVIGTQWDKGE